jgi:hypothetical protein
VGRGFHERNAVVLVRATVAEAFRDAKRGGGVKSALPGLPAEGLEGITFVLSPNARIVVTTALERNPSGTAKSVCMSYMLRGRRDERRGKDRDSVDRRIGKVSGWFTKRDGAWSMVVKADAGWEGGNRPE